MTGDVQGAAHRRVMLSPGGLLSRQASMGSNSQVGSVGKTGGARGNYAAPALEKAFDIIELLAKTPGGLTVSEIAMRLNRSMGELFRIVMVMERRGYLQKSHETDRIIVAYKLLDLAYRATPAQHLTRAAAPVMHALAREVGQSCHLVVSSGGHGLVVAREENPGPRGFAVKLGAIIDLASSCSGQVILAFSNPEQRTALLGGLSRGRKKADLADKLETIASRGYDSRPSPITQGVTDVSFPVLGFDGRLAAALTIPFVALIDGSQPVGFDSVRDRLGIAAREVSCRLGWRDGMRAPDASAAEAREARRRRPSAR